MYQKFFGLRDNPFGDTPDPRYLFQTPGTRETIARLLEGIQSRHAFTVLTGEVGSGKTTLINELFDKLENQAVATAFIYYTQLNSAELLEFVLADLGIPCESKKKDEMLGRLHERLLERNKAGELTLLIVDEAQNLTDEVLEEIRLLASLETPSAKLLQIVLSGQPEFEEKLRQPEFRQFNQQITGRIQTRPLSLEETQGYIVERLRVAGGDGQPLFSPEAVAKVHEYSRGIPRMINLLCDHALIGAYADQQPKVTAEIVEQVPREFPFNLFATPPAPSPRSAQETSQGGANPLV